MSNFFSFTRFWKVFKKHTAENYVGFLMSFAFVGGLISIMYGISIYITGSIPPTAPRSIAFIYAYLFFGTTMQAGRTFAKYSKKERAISDLTLPASHFEKFFVAWIYSFLLFTAGFLLTFYIVDTLFVDFAPSVPNTSPAVFNVFSNHDVVFKVFGCFAVLHALTMWGSIFFRKIHVPRTAIVLFAIIALLLAFNYQLLSTLINENIQFPFPFSTVFWKASKGDYFHISALETCYPKILIIGSALLLWAATYFTLKEKQV